MTTTGTKRERSSVLPRSGTFSKYTDGEMSYYPDTILCIRDMTPGFFLFIG
jgi:hypothetical protein